MQINRDRVTRPDSPWKQGVTIGMDGPGSLPLQFIFVSFSINGRLNYPREVPG